jgi:3-oxoacid CoA-transferase subunit A/glutaconate CoA-transferase subunit A
MPYLYFFDEAHIAEWLTLAKTEEGAQAYMQKYVYDVPDYAAYLELIGDERFKELWALEQFGRQP